MRIIAIGLVISAALLAEPAQAFCWSNHAYPSVGVARHSSGTSARGWHCSSIYASLNQTEWNAGRIRFNNTGMCLQADTSSVVTVRTCSGIPHQKWASYGGPRGGARRIYNHVWGSGIILALGGGGLGAGLSLKGPSDPYYQHHTRFWNFKP